MAIVHQIQTHRMGHSVMQHEASFFMQFSSQNNGLPTSSTCLLARKSYWLATNMRNTRLHKLQMFQHEGESEFWSWVKSCVLWVKVVKKFRAFFDPQLLHMTFYPWRTTFYPQHTIKTQTCQSLLDTSHLSMLCTPETSSKHTPWAQICQTKVIIFSPQRLQFFHKAHAFRIDLVSGWPFSLYILSPLIK
jgi:hypothetical protein